MPLAQDVLLGYYRHEDGTEVDFVVEHSGGLELVQVSADITSADTRRRELRALQASMLSLQCQHARIITLSAEETLKVDEGTIEILPGWLWALRRS